MNKRSIAIAAGLALAAGLATWYGLAHRETKPVVAAPKAPANHILLAADAPQRAFLKLEPIVEAALPAAGPFNGRLASADDLTARLFSPVNGRLLKVLVNVGDRVSQGMPLALLDSPEFAAAVADAHKAEADANVKERALQRVEALFGDEALSRRELEAAEADARAAKAELERARARLANLGSTLADSDGRGFVLRSPLDGVVLERQANPGTEVRSDAANPVFVVAGLGKLALLVDLPEKDAQQVRVGDGVVFSTDAAPADSLTSTVERITPAVDPVTRRVTLRAAVDNRDGRLRPEMYVRAALLERSAAKCLRVPISALLTQGLNATLFVEAKPGDFERRTVKLLRQDRDYAYLASDQGVARGEQVVSKGAMLLASELAGAE